MQALCHVGSRATAGLQHRCRQFGRRFHPQTQTWHFRSVLNGSKTSALHQKRAELIKTEPKWNVTFSDFQQFLAQMSQILCPKSVFDRDVAVGAPKPSNLSPSARTQSAIECARQDHSGAMLKPACQLRFLKTPRSRKLTMANRNSVPFACLFTMSSRSRAFALKFCL